MMMLVIQLGIILFAAKLMGMLFTKMRLPRVLGELVSGIIIGPYLLGSISLPGFRDGVFPIFTQSFPVTPELYGICSVAAVVLLFMVGLETDIQMFMRYSIAGSLVGIGGVLVSFVVGDFAAVFFQNTVLGLDVSFQSPSCLFMGVISTATSVGITARVLAEKRKLDSPEGVTILSGAVVDDVLGIILLAVVMGAISSAEATGGMNWAAVGMVAVKAVGIWLGATLIGLVASHQISNLLKTFKDGSSIAVMALGLALVLAGLFEEAKLAMIVGAYVMGLSLSRSDINRLVLERLDPVQTFLVPVFFSVMGMMVDVRLMFSPEILFLGLGFSALAVVAKVLGCGLPALFCNFNIIGALRIGCGMLPRGEVTLIIAGVGLASGHLSRELFGVVVLMTLLTTLVAPVIIGVLFDKPKSGLVKAVEDERKTRLSFAFPSGGIADLLLNKLRAAFSSEGFFVHSISRTGHMYQVRKDDVVIGFILDGNEIVFECAQSDVSFINTAMCEVLAELEITARELRKPVDSNSISSKIQDPCAGPGKGKRGSITRYITEKTIEPNLKSTTKPEIICELLGVLKKSGLLKDVDAAKKAVMLREEGMSTGMQHGIAIPHGRTDAVKHLVTVIGVSRDGVDFDAIDGELSYVFVLSLSPVSAAAPHMRYMSIISQVLDQPMCQALRVCKSRKDMFKLLSGELSPDIFLSASER
ncbi:hypothetical protein BVX94_02205 [bacterium B17]|nr:hypothetical protein BVX94_02205 [bacterium B17]